MRRFQPSGRIALFPFLIMTVIGLIIAAVLGVAAMLIAQSIYLVPLSPLIMAAAAGVLAAFVTRAGKNRSPLLAALIGLSIGLTLYGVYRYSEYVHVLYTVEAQRNPKGDIFANLQGALSPSNIAQVDRTLRNDGIAEQGFVGYVLWSASEGMQITRLSASSSSSGGLFLDRNMTLGYWGLEFLIVVGAALYAALQAARAPYDENQRRWIKDDQFRLFGTVDASMEKDFVRALEEGHWQRAGSLMMPGISGGAVTVLGYKLGDDFGDVLLRVNTTKRNRQQQSAQGVLSMSEFKSLLASAARAPRQGAYQTNMPY